MLKTNLQKVIVNSVRIFTSLALIYICINGLVYYSIPFFENLQKNIEKDRNKSIVYTYYKLRDQLIEIKELHIRKAYLRQVDRVLYEVKLKTYEKQEQVVGY